MSVYMELKAAGCQLEHHESDLYVKCSLAAKSILQGTSRIVEPFKDNIDGECWLLLPFAYDPFWGDKDA